MFVVFVTFFVLIIVGTSLIKTGLNELFSIEINLYESVFSLTVKFTNALLMQNAKIAIIKNTIKFAFIDSFIITLFLFIQFISYKFANLYYYYFYFYVIFNTY